MKDIGEAYFVLRIEICKICLMAYWVYLKMSTCIVRLKDLMWMVIHYVMLVFSKEIEFLNPSVRIMILKERYETDFVALGMHTFALALL